MVLVMRWRSDRAGMIACLVWLFYEVFFLHAQVIMLSDDYMVYNGNIHDFARLDQPFCSRDIFPAGGGVAAGVVMDKDNGGTGIFYGFPKYFPRMNHGSR